MKSINAFSTLNHCFPLKYESCFQIAAFSSENLKQERNMHRSSTIYKIKYSKHFVDFHVRGQHDSSGVVWRTCGLFWCFYQLFRPSFWWHPFNGEDPSISIDKQAHTIINSLITLKKTYITLVSISIKDKILVILDWQEDTLSSKSAKTYILSKYTSPFVKGCSSSIFQQKRKSKQNSRKASDILSKLLYLHVSLPMSGNFGGTIL